MIKPAFLKTLCYIILLLHIYEKSNSQIIITPDTSARRLSQQLVGNGITVTNFNFTGERGSAGFFNTGSIQSPLGIDSGIVLSTGYVKTNFYPGTKGIDNIAADGTYGTNRASSSLGFAGDADLSTIIPENYDAAVLEFDFVPTGDSIVFRYVFASEEYPNFNCTQYNDVFAFYISGPGFTGKKNIALVPNTNIPVAINSINSGVVDPMMGLGGDMTICGSMGPGSPFTQLYVDNRTGLTITFNGFTRVLTASAKVQPCQIYHLKMAIADGVDRLYDSGVFLEAKSLRSEGVKIVNRTPIGNNGRPRLTEGCNSGGIQLRRLHARSYPQQVLLRYAGTAVNGADITQMPASVTIPANDSVVFVPIVPLADYVSEGTEVFKIYVSDNCINGNANYSDSIEVEILEVDTLVITPGPVAGICKGSSIGLLASAGYNTYTWTPAARLTGSNTNNPMASPVTDSTIFECTAKREDCIATGSVMLVFKKLQLVEKKDVSCNTTTTGSIKVSAGAFWKAPLQYWVNNQPVQNDSTFNNLPIGNYTVKVKDATGCTDSLVVNIGRFISNLRIDSLQVQKASCTDSTSGKVSLFISGGRTPYRFATDNNNYTNSSILPANTGNHFTTVKDANGCTDTAAFQITYNNVLNVEAGQDIDVCTGSTVQLHASANSNNIQWSPAIPAATGTNILHPQFTPTATGVYTLTATYGFCVKMDSVKVTVHQLPVANAGKDTSICTGGTLRLRGSGGTIYKWSPATYLDNPTSMQPIANPAADLKYSLTVTDQYNCTSAVPATVKVHVVPPVVASAGKDTLVATGQPLHLSGKQVNDTTATVFTWTPDIGLNNPNIIQPVAVLGKDQTYLLTMRTPEGCEGRAAVTIKVFDGPEIYVPTGFTPNGDGRNDVLRGTVVGLKEFKFFRVFNRYGQLVFSTTEPGKGWDGKINGIPQTGQTFVWAAEGIGYNNVPVQKRGTVVLVP